METEQSSPQILNFWTKDEDAIIVDCFNKRNKTKEAFEFALTRLPNRNFAGLSNRFYEQSRAGNYDGKIHNSKFKKLRERQILVNDRKQKPHIIIKPTVDRLIVLDDTIKKPSVVEEETPLWRDTIQKVSETLEENHSKLAKEDIQYTFIVEGHSSLGGIPIHAKFKITGNFKLEVLPLTTD